MSLLRRIAILGGTGALGRGLATRLSTSHEVLIGSRDTSKAEAAAKEVASRSGGRISGTSNIEAAHDCDIAILAVPDLPSDSFLQEFGTTLDHKLVISPVVPMTVKEGVFTYSRPKGSAAEEIAAALKNSRVAAAFHTIPAGKLLDPTIKLEYDVLVATDIRLTYSEMVDLISSVNGLRPIYVGPLSLARYIESLTPLLLNISKRNGLKDPSFRLV
ncbi:MAG: NADPH-dependent F420 reductase [Thaumarchaeota archaeon]|nr:NADPH-dependent F420 reductase [Nitrososphaerota archaeon]